MQQFKIRKSAEEILGTYIKHLKKGEAEFHTSDGFKIIVQHLELAPEAKPAKRVIKSLYGVFSQAKVSKQELDESKRICNYSGLVGRDWHDCSDRDRRHRRGRPACLPQSGGRTHRCAPTDRSDRTSRIG